MYRKVNPHLADKTIIQGDVFGEYINALPSGCKPVKSNIIALGESTGHHHIVEEAKTFTDAFGNLFSLVEKTTHLLHQQHEAWVLHPGVIQWGERGVMQVEYSGEEERRATD